jgi:predicted nuclease of predicted toxin-antitoxin system
VKLLLDENLSDRIVYRIIDLYPNSEHVKTLALTNKEQEIQRYEATEYAAANLAWVIEVSQVLGLKLQSRTGIAVELERSP